MSAVLAQGGGLFVRYEDGQSVINKYTVNVPNYIFQLLFTLSRKVNIPNSTLIQRQKLLLRVFIYTALKGLLYQFVI